MNGDQREALRRTFEGYWAELRGSRLYAGQPRSAASAAGVSLAHEALRLASDCDDDEFLNDAWRMLAYSLSANAQWLEAIPYYEKAIAGYESRGEHVFAARRLRIGYVSGLMFAGRYEEALGAAQTAERWLIESGDKEGYARLCTNIANLHQRLDRHEAACDYYVKALAVFESANDQRSAALVYQNIGYPLARLDRFDEAESMYVRAEQAASDLEMPEIGVVASYNRAYLYFLRGRYSEALQAFAQVRERFRNSSSLPHLGLCDLDEAEIYLQLNMPRDAATLAQSAHRQFQSLGMKFEQAKALALHAAALTQQQLFVEALEKFEASRLEFENEGNRYRIAVLDLYMADVHLEMRRYPEAHSLATRARQQFESLEIASRRMDSLVMLGRISLKVGDVEAAKGYSEEIAAIAVGVRSALLTFPHYLLRGRIAEEMHDRKGAEEAFRMAAEHLESDRGRLLHDDLKVTFFRGRDQVYESLVRLALDEQDGSLEQAYAWCERSKSRGLIELLSHYLPSVRPRAEDELTRRIHRLREELNHHYILLKPETRSDLSGPAYESVILKEQELSKTLREIAPADPEYVSLHLADSLRLGDVQEFLPARTTVVEYFSTHDEVLAFVVTKGGSKAFRRLLSPDRLRSLQERLAFQLEKFLLGRDYAEAHSEQLLDSVRQRLQELYSALIEPLAADLQTPHLTIIPHGALHFLPFHAFFDGQRYLIDRHEIAYAPSASVLRFCMEPEDVAAGPPLIVGVADEMAPMVDAEIARIRELFPDSRILFGAQATRSAFADAVQSAAFIHIATHATFRQDNPMFSSFKLADGYITARDLFSMRCRTTLVALSACQSGLAEVSGSDDLLGLTRGFLYAGARSLLLSLWSVNDESTAALMEDFYREWRGGASKSRALQAAMGKVRQTYPHPFHWAPFVLVGRI